MLRLFYESRVLSLGERDLLHQSALSAGVGQVIFYLAGGHKAAPAGSMQRFLNANRLAMNILIVAPSLKLGGLENSVSTMTNWLAGAGYSLTLVICYKGKRFYEVSDNVDVVEPTFSPSSLGKVKFYLSWILFVRRAIISKKPDVVLSYGDYHNSLVIVASFFLKVPVVVTDRASPGLKFPLHFRLVRALTYPKCSGVIAQTQRAAHVKKNLLNKGVKIGVIPNPVRYFEPLSSEGRKNIVLAAARHYHVKGLDRLVHAFSKVNAPGWQLHIAGSPGPETKSLEELVASLGLSERVRFLGPVKDMAAIYSSAGIFVLPSRSEGFPNALIEAMSLGSPSIAFDINAGPSEIINDGVNGVLVPDGDVDAMAGAVQYLVDNPEVRDALSCEAIKVNDFLSLDSVGRQYENFLMEVLST